MWFMGKGSQILLSLNATRIKRHSKVRCEVPKNIGGLSVVPRNMQSRYFPKTGGRFLGPTKAPMNKTGTWHSTEKDDMA